MKNTLVLEPSTNTHTLTGNNIVSKELGDSALRVNLGEGGAFVSHGEHAVLAVESKTFFKYVQKELNPISRLMMNSID